VAACEGERCVYEVMALGGSAITKPLCLNMDPQAGVYLRDAVGSLMTVQAVPPKLVLV